MKHLVSLLIFLLISIGVCSTGTDIDKMAYHNALDFTLINKGFDDTTTPFTRLPAYLNDTLREGHKVVAENSAGIGIRFATNSTSIGVKYMLTTNFHMNHMADTGTKGTDLYRLHDDGSWHFVATTIPGNDSLQNKKYVDNLDGLTHEYLIYLPLYDGVEWIEIGVDSSAVISKPCVDSPRSDKKIVFYGTSITQGGCASRTGMVATSILQRQLNVQCVNLGFSGQGRLDPYIAEAMSTIDNVVAFVVDPVSNCKTEMIDTLTNYFVETLHKAHPHVPIFLVEGQSYAHEPYDTKQQIKMPETNKMLFKKYQELHKKYPKNIFYIDRKNLIGPDGEGTVDGAHLTDLGFVYYAAKLKPYLEAVLNGTTIPFQDKIQELYK